MQNIVNLEQIARRVLSENGYNALDGAFLVEAFVRDSKVLAGEVLRMESLRREQMFAIEGHLGAQECENKNE